MKVKNEIVVSVFSIQPDAQPPSSVSECSLPVLGGGGFGDRFTAAYGNRGKETCGHIATRYAQELGKTCHPIDVALQVREAHSTRQMITRSHLEDGHEWIHFERVASSLRDQIKEQFLWWIFERSGRQPMELASTQTLQQICLAHPHVVGSLFCGEPGLNFIAHPVATEYSPSRPIFALTARKPLSECCAWARVRHRDTPVLV